jgi:hypothetical protein
MNMIEIISGFLEVVKALIDFTIVSYLLKKRRTGRRVPVP